MSTSPLSHLFHGSFAFVEPASLAELFPEAERCLPIPYPIYLEDETASPFQGFPILLSEELGALREALDQYLEAEEEAQISALARQPFSRTGYAAAWNRYRNLFSQATQNAVMASYGRRFGILFWLHHSLDVARRLRECPRRVVRLDAELGRRYGDQIKYRTFNKYRANVRQTVFEMTSRLAAELEDGDEGFFAMLDRMLDNVLLFTEEHVSSDLAELTSYFNGFLNLDGRDFRQRFERLAEWHEAALGSDAELSAAASELAGLRPGDRPRRLLMRAGYASYLSRRKGYRASELLSAEQVQSWEALLIRLKEFEIFNTLRGQLLPVRRDGGRLVFRAGGLDRTWVGQRLLYLSASTRPLDFMSQSVIDPLVHRYGLIYDITNFSIVVSMLRRAGNEMQEQAFRQMFKLQRRVNRLASSYRLQLEKYLGDGAFYTSRQPLSALLCAIHLQRLYREALANGLPFNQGLRVGLNFGHYRLIPIQVAGEGGPERYEFFGHGVVELSRLTTGKSSQEIDEIKNLLISYGYPAPAVLRFFEPLAGRNLDVVDKEEEARPFFAYVNRNGNLINEGIVATGEFLTELEASLPPTKLFGYNQGPRRYVVLSLPDGGSSSLVGIRKLGATHLKGLDNLIVYEVIDAADATEGELVELTDHVLTLALDRAAAAAISRSDPAKLR